MRIQFLLVFLGLGLSSSVMAEDKTLTQKMLKPVLRHQCNDELEQSKIWYASTFLLENKLKQSIAKQVCECVSDHALNNIKNADLAKSLISEEAKNRVIQQAIVNSISICVPKLIK